MATLDQFAVNIARRGDEIERGVAKTMRRVFVATAGTVVFATPVDTGRARGGWLAGLNSSPGGEGALDKAGTSVIGRANAVGRSLKVSDVGYISNNVPYIGDLDQGSSQQAPAGFVRKAVQAGVATVGSIVILKP